MNLSFFGTGAILDRAATEGGGLSYNPMFAAMKALGTLNPKPFVEFSGELN